MNNPARSELFALLFCSFTILHFTFPAHAQAPVISYASFFGTDLTAAIAVTADKEGNVYVARNNGRFQLTLMDVATRQSQILTDTAKDESPSFAPNGRMILYASEIGGRGVLAAVSSDGRVKQKLSVQAGDVREPAWGPFLKH